MTAYKTDEEIAVRFANVARSGTFAHIRDAFGLENKSVFDIGCSYGEFLTHFGAGSVGLSIIPEEAEYGARRGLDIRRGNIESAAVPVAETFDALFANNIFEHLYSPHRFLVSVKRYLKPDGVLILGVPVVPGVAPLMRLKKFRGALAVGHINFFTRRTLVKTVERAGWRVRAARSFHFAHPLADAALNPLAPHIYVIASVAPDFTYHLKRLRELAGYGAEA